MLAVTFVAMQAERRQAKKMPAFSRYIGIDYCGAETATSSLKGLRVYMADPESPPAEVEPPPSTANIGPAEESPSGSPRASRRGRRHSSESTTPFRSRSARCVFGSGLDAPGGSRGTLQEFLEPPLTGDAQALGRVEGWILGVK